MVSGINFLTGILLARYLGLHEFGVFSLAWMAVLFLNNIQYAIISAPMMSIGPKQPEENMPAYFGAVMIQQAIVTFFSFLMIMTVALSGDYIFQGWNSGHLAIPLACSAVVFQIQDFLRRYFFTMGKLSAAFTNDAISYGGQLVLLIWLFQSDLATSVSVLWVIAITSFVAVIVGFLQTEAIALPTRSLFKGILSRHWEFSKWLGASALMQWISGNLFTIVAGAIMGAWATGALKAAQNIVGILHVVFLGLENFVPVSASRIFISGGRKALNSYIKKISIYLGIATLLFSLIIGVYPGFWLSLLYGEEYSQYAWVLRIYAMAYVVFAFIRTLNYEFRTREMTRPVFWSVCLPFVFSVIASTNIILSFGILGAVVGFFMVKLVECSILLYFRRLHENT